MWEPIKLLIWKRIIAVSRKGKCPTIRLFWEQKSFSYILRKLKMDDCRGSLGKCMVCSPVLFLYPVPEESLARNSVLCALSQTTQLHLNCMMANIATRRIM